uniref:Uncharacterized protein n=1 Tax=Cyprinus carpio TaxID=7962 RepID=A0A8C1VQ16_CYPCA
MAEEVIKIYILQDNDGAVSNVGVVIEDITVLSNLANLSRACCSLLGLTYALDLRYPKTHKYSLEVYTKLFLELDPSRLSVKVQRLKNYLLAYIYFFPTMDVNGSLQLSVNQHSLKYLLCSTEERNSYRFGTT